MQALCHDAHLTQSDLHLRGIVADQFPYDRRKRPGQRLDGLPHNLFKQAGGVGEFLADDFKLVVFGIDDPLNQGNDASTQSLFSRCVGRDSAVGGIGLQRPLKRLPPCHPIQRFLVAEIVVHGRDIRAGLFADLRNRCVPVAFFCKYLAGRL